MATQEIEELKESLATLTRADRREIIRYCNRLDRQDTSHPGTGYLETLRQDFRDALGVDVSIRCRNANIVAARQVFFYLAHKESGCSTSEIGAFLGYDHCTVLHAENTIRTAMQYPKSYPLQTQILKTIQQCRI